MFNKMYYCTYFKIIMKSQQGNKTTYPRTISLELLEAWQRFRRQNDGQTIGEALGYSRPVIDRALNFGYVKKENLTDLITGFFTKRLEAEKKAAANLMSYAQPKNAN